MRWIRSIELSPALVLFLCGLVYLDPFGLALPGILAATLHELAHLAALLALGVRVEYLRLQLGGAVIGAALGSGRQEALATAAGPACNLLLLLLFRWVWVKFCLANAVLLFFNLLPVYPLDGGRLLSVLLRRVFGTRIGRRISQSIGILTTAGLLVFGAYAGFFLGYGPLAALPAVVAVVKFLLSNRVLPVKI